MNQRDKKKNKKKQKQKHTRSLGSREFQEKREGSMAANPTEGLKNKK